MTLCKFQVYILNDQQTHWVQCTLPINIYIEKMYFIAAIWSIVLFVMTLVNIAQYAVLLTCYTQSFISKYLNMHNEKEPIEEHNLKNLRADDILVLRLIRKNTSEHDVSHVIQKLNEL